MSDSDEARFWANVEMPTEDGCWVWLGHRITGYGGFWAGGKNVMAHRYAYGLFGGVIPRGLEIDHLCRDRSCVNPKHMEPVTHIENCRRGNSAQVSRVKQLAKIHCPRGHPYDKQNTHIAPNGQRKCKICANITALKSKRKKRLELKDSKKGKE